MVMIRSGGLGLHVRADGPEQAPALLLLNSLGTDLHMWDGLVASLAGEFRIIRFDKPGHGRSETAPRPYDMAGLAAHALAALDRFGVASAHVLGLSIGGQIAMALAAAQPGRVNRLVLSNTAARIGSGAIWADRIGALERGGIDAIADAVMARWFSRRWRLANPRALAGWRNMLCQSDLTGYLGCCDALATADLSETCRQLCQRTLVIAGGEDGATPPEAVRATASLISGAEFVVIDGVGHLPCIEDPARYLVLLRDFLATDRA